MKISDLMVKDVSTCSGDTSLNDIAIAMWNNDCGSVLIVNEQNQPVGIVTDRDIAIGSALKHKSLWEIRADEITAEKTLYTCSESDSVTSALELMQEHQIRRLPIINHQSELAGIISMGDIIASTGKGKNKLPYSDTERMIKAVSAHHNPMPIAV